MLHLESADAQVKIVSSKMEFSEKVVLITGSSSGIGASIAKKFSALGALIVLHGRNVEKLQNVSEDCTNVSPKKIKPLIIVGDLTEVNTRERLIDETMQTFGKIDVLVNNAGYPSFANVNTTTVQDLRDMLEIHTVIPFDLVLRAMPYLEKSQGCIANVTSISGQNANPNMLTFCVGKSCLSHLTRCMALALGPKSIRVNAVAPGHTKTKPGSSPYDAIAEKYYPLGRYGTIEEVADIVTFLCSEKSDFITGEVFPIDGGAHVGRKATD